MEKRTKDILSILTYIIVVMGCSIALYWAILMYVMFLSAWFYPTKEVTLMINEFGEADLEFIVFIPTVLIMFIGFAFMMFNETRLIKELFKKEKKQRKKQK